MRGGGELGGTVSVFSDHGDIRRVTSVSQLVSERVRERLTYRVITDLKIFSGDKEGGRR